MKCKPDLRNFKMKHYNPTELMLNMPVMYNEADSDDNVLISGHFASYDVEGNAYVWTEGGTSYTRSVKQVVKCGHCFPMTTRDEGILRTKLIEEGGVSIPELPKDYVQPIVLEMTGVFYKTRSGKKVKLLKKLSNKKFNSYLGTIITPPEPVPDPYDNVDIMEGSQFNTSTDTKFNTSDSEVPSEERYRSVAYNIDGTVYVNYNGKPTDDDIVSYW